MPVSFFLFSIVVQFSELLQLVVFLMTRFASMLSPSVADVKAMAQHFGSGDREVHQAALDCLRMARALFTAEQLCAMAGQVPFSLLTNVLSI